MRVLTAQEETAHCMSAMTPLGGITHCMTAVKKQNVTLNVWQPSQQQESTAHCMTAMTAPVNTAHCVVPECNAHCMTALRAPENTAHIKTAMTASRWSRPTTEWQ